jgi:FMN phosphatase YigB (HAD superfamily)
LDAGMQTVWVNREAQPWAHEAQPHLSVVSLQELCNRLDAVPARP